MDYIDGQNLLQLTNHLISKTWLFFLLGLLHLAFIEYKAIINSFKVKQKSFHLWHPVFHRLLYLLLGLTLIYGSWTITTFASNLIAASLPTPEFSTSQAVNFWNFIKYQSGLSGLISTILMILAGLTLLLSAGGRWLVNLAKLFATLSILYLVLTAFVLFS